MTAIKSEQAEVVEAMLLQRRQEKVYATPH
jgi:hypothetical protein